MKELLLRVKELRIFDQPVTFDLSAGELWGVSGKEPVGKGIDLIDWDFHGFTVWVIRLMLIVSRRYIFLKIFPFPEWRNRSNIRVLLQKRGIVKKGTIEIL